MSRIELMETVRDYQVKKISRREFLKQATAFVGTVAANSLLVACAAFPNENAPPVLEENIIVSDGLSVAGGLLKGVVTFVTPSGETVTGYLAKPVEDMPRDGVIVIQEWWGLNEHIKGLADRFAAEGFVAFAPDLYHGQVATEPDEARKLAMELVATEAVQEIQAGIDYLLAEHNVRPKVGVVGFCMGGGLVLQTALASDDLSGGIVFYGSPLAPAEAKKVKAPILTFLGTADRISVGSVAGMHEAFDEAGIENEYHIYDGAQHAFFNETRASYDAERAADAWMKSLAWFRRFSVK